MGRGERWTAGITIVLALTLSVAAGAIAAKSGNGGGGKGKGGAAGGSSSLSLVLLDQDGQVNAGDRVTFDITTSASRPFVQVDCYQGTDWVYVASVGFFDAYPWAKEFTLAADSWPGGAARCTATLYTTRDGTRTTTLASLPFDVAA